MATRLVLLLCLSAASAWADQIYRTVDEAGNVVFTDVPPIDRSGQPAGREIAVEPTNTYDAPAAPTAPAAGPTTTDAPAVAYYAQLTIVDPDDDATIRENSGEVLIQAVLTPGLRADDRLLLVLDGVPTDLEAEDGIFQLSNVDRGTHTAGARVVNSDDEVQIESDPVTFHLLRYALPRPTPTLPIVKPKPTTNR